MANVVRVAGLFVGPPDKGMSFLSFLMPTVSGDWSKAKAHFRTAAYNAMAGACPKGTPIGVEWMEQFVSAMEAKGYKLVEGYLGVMEEEKPEISVLECLAEA
jgi:hypothetical protein